MCQEDIAIGRSSHASPVTVAVDSAATPLLGASRHRTAILFCPPSAGVVTFCAGRDAAAGEGIMLAATSAPVLLRIGDVGDLVTQRWTAIQTVAGTAATVYETSWPRNAKQEDEFDEPQPPRRRKR